MKLMKLKSEMVSNILKIMLCVLVALNVLNLIGTLIYSMNVSFYMDYAYSINGFINLMSVSLYYIIIIIYLIWIYRVHMDLNNRFARYPRSPGMSIICMILPFFSFYGLPSTFSIIGKYYLQAIAGVEKQGRWVRRLAVPLIICIIAVWILNKLTTQSGENTSAALLIGANLTELITHAVFLALCIFVSQGLKIIQSKDQAALLNSDLTADPEVPNQEA